MLPTQLQFFMKIYKIAFPGNQSKKFISSDSEFFTESEYIFGLGKISIEKKSAPRNSAYLYGGVKIRVHQNAKEQRWTDTDTNSDMTRTRTRVWTRTGPISSDMSSDSDSHDIVSLIKAFWLRKRFWITASFEMSIWIFNFGDFHFKLFISCELNQHEKEGNDCNCQKDKSNKNKNPVPNCLARYSKQLFAMLAFFFIVYFTNFWIGFSCWNFNNFAHLDNFELLRFLSDANLKYVHDSTAPIRIFYIRVTRKKNMYRFNVFILYIKLLTSYFII